jgi:hypothetical protein
MGSVIHHLNPIFWESLDLKSEISNSISGTCYSISVTFRENVTFTDEGDLYIIWVRISRRFQIWSQKFEIPSVASAVAIFVFQPHFQKI